MGKTPFRYLTLFFLLVFSFFWTDLKVLRQARDGGSSCFFLMRIRLQSAAFAQEQPPQGQSPLDRGLELLDQKKYDDALKAFEDAMTLEPRNPLPYYYAGVTYRLKKDLKNALNVLNKAVQVAPGFPHAILEIGIVFEELGRFNNAMEAYKALAEAKEETPVVSEARQRLKRLTVAGHFRKAERHFQEKQYEDTLKELDALLSLTPENADAHFAAGMSYNRLRRFKEAIDSFKRAAEINPKHADAYFQLAMIYELVAKYEDAISALRQVISLAPDSPQGKEAEKRLRENEDKLQVRRHFEAVADLIKKEEWTEALEETGSILAIEPENPNALFNHGLVLHQLKEDDLAVESLKKAVGIDPKLQKAHYQLAVIYDDSGKFTEAVETYEKALAISEKTPEAEKARERLDMLRPLVAVKESARELKELIGKEDVSGAIIEMEALVKVKQDDPKLFASLATLYVKAGRFREAASALEKAIHLSPKEPDMRFMLAKIYDMLKEYGKAAEAYNIVASQAKQTPMGEEAAANGRESARRHHLILAKKYLDSGDYEASLREMESVIEITPDDPVALYNTGVLYFRLNRNEDAVPPLRRAVSIAPDYTAAWLQLGFTLERLRKYTGAREAFEKIIEIKGDSREAKIAAGKIGVLKEYEALESHLDKGIELMEKKNWNGARKEIDAVLAITPKNYMAYYYLGIILDNMGIPDEAKEAFKKTIEINPKFTRVYLAFGDLLINEGEFNEARKYFDQARTIGKDTPDAEIAETRLKELRPWSGSFSISQGYNSNISFASKAKAKDSINSRYALGMNYSLLREKDSSISTGVTVSQTIYYDSQSQPNGYTLYLNSVKSLPGENTLSADLTYSKSYFDGKPTFLEAGFSGEAKTEPRTIPTSAAFTYGFSSENSLINDSSDAERHNLSASVSQKVSLRNTIGGSYAFNIQKNLDPMGSNYANRTHSFSVNCSRSLWSGVSASLRYSRSFVNYSNPDSNSFFQQFRRNTNEAIGGGFSFKLASRISSSLSYSYTVNRTNLPAPTSEERRKLAEILATPIPTVGGGYRQYSVSLSLSMNF